MAKQCPLVKNSIYAKNQEATIIAIDAPRILAGGKEFNIPIYAEFIHVLFQNSNPNTL
jgi:hypothetical protein